MSEICKQHPLLALPAKFFLNGLQLKRKVLFPELENFPTWSFQLHLWVMQDSTRWCFFAYFGHLQLMHVAFKILGGRNGHFSGFQSEAMWLVTSAEILVEILKGHNRNNHFSQ